MRNVWGINKVLLGISIWFRKRQGRKGAEGRGEKHPTGKNFWLRPWTQKSVKYSGGDLCWRLGGRAPKGVECGEKNFMPVCWISRRESSGYYCADVWRVLAHFVANTVAHVHRPAGQIGSSTACVCRSFHEAHGRSAVGAQPWPWRQGYFSHAVYWSAVSYDPLSHSTRCWR